MTELVRAALAAQIRPIRALLRTGGDWRKLRVLLRGMRGARYQVTSNREHLQAAMDWLCAAQDATGHGGVSAFFDHARGGWVPAYPETTGYIIPTFLDYASFSADDRYRSRAIRMVNWLLTVQNEDGSFPIGPLWPHWKRRPMVFDTGQILHGLVRMYEETANPAYLSAARRAGDWLATVQDADGSWRRFDYLDVVHSYSSRVAWALLRLNQVSPDVRYRQAGYRNLVWCRNQQQPDGWFANASFVTDGDPVTHTIAYTIRGLLEGGLLLSDESLVASARRGADALKQRQAKDGYLRGTFGPGWRSTVTWSCLTGDVQMARIWLRLFELTQDESYLEAAKAANTFVKATQVRGTGLRGIDGGIAGSYPIQGEYQSFQIVNWAAKFFVDSLLLEEAVTSRLSVHQQAVPVGPSSHP